jgi:uncharacterized protein (UPF0332 family)
VTARYDPEVRANLERARTSLAAARQLYESHFYDIAASRPYYTAFYAATALFVDRGISFRRHSSLIALFHREFVHTGILDSEYGRDLNALFTARAVGDYGTVTHVSPGEAESAINAAARFLAAIEALLGQTSGRYQAKDGR